MRTKEEKLMLSIHQNPTQEISTLSSFENGIPMNEIDSNQFTHYKDLFYLRSHFNLKTKTWELILTDMGRLHIKHLSTENKKTET